MPKPWDAAVEKAAPKLVDETRVNLRSAARMQPKPLFEADDDSAADESLDRALAAVGTGLTRNDAFPMQAEGRVAPEGRRRGWGAVAAGIFLLSASALTYGLVRGPLGGADWLPEIFAQAPDGPAVDGAGPADDVAVAVEGALPSVSEFGVAGAPVALSEAPATLADGRALEVEAVTPALAAAPGAAPGNALPADRLAWPTPGDRAPQGSAEAGPNLLASLSSSPVSNDLAAAGLATRLPGAETAPGVGTELDGLTPRPDTALAALPDPAATEAPVPYSVALVSTPGLAPDLPAPTGVQSEAPIALATGALASDPGVPGFEGASDTERADVAAALAVPEAGPPALVNGFADPGGPELALLNPGDAAPFSRAPVLDASDAVYAPALLIAAPSAPQGIGAAPELDAATEPPAAIVPQTPATDATRLVMHAPRSVSEAALAEAAVDVSAVTGFAAETRPLVDFAISASNVRFFHPDDREAASAVAEALSARLRDFTDFQPAPPLGTIEVWLSGNPVETRPVAAVTQSRPTPAAPAPARAVETVPRRPVFRTSTTTRTRSGVLRPSGQ